jgi:hypothetical protein
MKEVEISRRGRPVSVGEAVALILERIGAHSPDANRGGTAAAVDGLPLGRLGGLNGSGDEVASDATAEDGNGPNDEDGDADGHAALAFTRGHSTC